MEAPDRHALLLPHANATGSKATRARKPREGPSEATKTKLDAISQTGITVDSKTTAGTTSAKYRSSTALKHIPKTRTGLVQTLLD
eukprot:7572709-Pyramimonas_sp.AAC.1